MMRRRAERGFTLIEVVFAILIMAGIIAYLYRTADALTQTTRISNWKVSAAAENFKAIGVLSEDLRLAFADAVGENRYMIAADGSWISYRTVDGETLTSEGAVVPIVSPRIFVYRHGDKLLRVAVDEAMATTLPLPPEAILEVRVIANKVAEVEFGDPLVHSGAFVVKVTTLVGNPDNDQHVQTTNFVSVSSLNEDLLFGRPPPAEPVDPVGYVTATRTDGPHLRFQLQNNTTEDIVFDEMKLDWSPDKVSYYTEIKLDGTKVWYAWFDPTFKRAGAGELRTLTNVPSWTLPAGGTVDVRYKSFKSKRWFGHTVKSDPEDAYTLTLGLSGVEVAVVTIPAVE